MRSSRSVILLVAVASLCCDAPVSFGDNGQPIVRQAAIADIACGPSAIFNWMSQGGDDLQSVLASFSDDRTPEQTVRQIIDTYGLRASATRPSVTRYGEHNGGVGSINLMVMANELLADHLESPPSLRGEYLHRADTETTRAHLERIRRWLSASIDSGVPVLFYLRAYERTAGGGRPGMVFGHHVVITALDEIIVDGDPGSPRIGFTFADSGTGRFERGTLLVAASEFSAPTFTYRFDGKRAVTTEKLATGRPLLEVRIPSYESANPPREVIITAHFATFAESGG